MRTCLPKPRSQRSATIRRRLAGVSLLAGVLCGGRVTTAADLTADQVLRRGLDHDPWGMGGATIKARLTLTDKRGSTEQLGFSAQSVQYDAPLAKSIVRFTAPPELRGAGFLQVQKRNSDDDRFLFLPDLARSRRISGNLRNNAFMGTDFSFADLDRRDLREGQVTFSKEAVVLGVLCYGLDVVPPKAADSDYSHIELWIAKDTFLPTKMNMYDRSRVPLKAFLAERIDKIDGEWFITRSLMTNTRTSHSTLLVLDHVAVTKSLPDSTFSLGALERF
jgi:hypothetical protein